MEWYVQGSKKKMAFVEVPFYPAFCVALLSQHLSHHLPPSNKKYNWVSSGILRIQKKYCLKKKYKICFFRNERYLLWRRLMAYINLLLSFEVYTRMAILGILLATVLQGKLILPETIFPAIPLSRLLIESFVLRAITSQVFRLSEMCVTTNRLEVITLMLPPPPLPTPSSFWIRTKLLWRIEVLLT